MDAALPLLAWLSPSFPIGAFAYSHGVEAAVEAGDIADAQTLGAWVRDLLEHGGGRNDALLLAASWRAIDGGDHAALDAINDLALALPPAGDRHFRAPLAVTAYYEPAGALDDIRPADEAVLAAVMRIATDPNAWIGAQAAIR